MDFVFSETHVYVDNNNNENRGEYNRYPTRFWNQLVSFLSCYLQRSYFNYSTYPRLSYPQSHLDVSKTYDSYNITSNEDSNGDTERVIIEPLEGS